MFEAIPIRAQSQADGSQHQDPPQIHARTARGLPARQDGVIQKLENLIAQRRMAPDPLQAGENRREFVTTAEGQDDPLDGQDLKAGLGVKMLAHGNIYH